MYKNFKKIINAIILRIRNNLTLKKKQKLKLRITSLQFKKK